MFPNRVWEQEYLKNMDSDNFYMKRALRLSRKGEGKVSPNPLVGAVIVKNGTIIGDGYHKYFGGNHAEINAIKNAREDVSGSSLYINLEPCCHYGKTPPCANEIVRFGIKKVIISNRDPNPVVNGKSIAFLKKQGVEITEGVLKEEDLWQNRFYYKYITRKIPYVLIKIAQSINSKIKNFSDDDKWISSIKSRKKVHYLRKKMDAVLIGMETAIQDNPELTVRHVRGRDPLRVILDPFLETDPGLNVYKDNNALIFSDTDVEHDKLKRFADKDIEVIRIKKENEDKLPIQEILKKLGQKNISSVLIEGGARIFSSFIKERAFDELLLFVAPRVYPQGLDSFSSDILKDSGDFSPLSFKEIKKSGPDVMLRCVPEWNEK